MSSTPTAEPRTASETLFLEAILRDITHIAMEESGVKGSQIQLDFHNPAVFINQKPGLAEANPDSKPNHASYPCYVVSNLTRDEANLLAGRLEGVLGQYTAAEHKVETTHYDGIVMTRKGAPNPRAYICVDLSSFTPEEAANVRAASSHVSRASREAASTSRG